MSDFKFSCPQCSQSIVCDTSNAGMQIPCPACQTLLTVPQPPPAAPAAPTPGKLSINKTAHQSHAAPAPAAPAAKAPAARPAHGPRSSASAPKKKSPLVPILLGCGIVAALAVGWFAFGAPYLKEQAEKKRQAEEAQKAAEEAQRQAAIEAAKPKPPKPAWKLDLANVQFPDTPAAGKEHGVNFTADTAVLQNNSLTLRQASTSPRQFVIGLPLKLGETPAGKTFEVTPTNTVGTPRVMLNWKDEGAKMPGVESYSKGYAMKLAFDTNPDGKISGKIYLCLPDPEQSFVAGNFSINPKNTATVQPVAAPGAGAPMRRRGGP